ncbi:sulfatase [Haliangium ochraceum DSM 14365]|uniref:Sulfatase n=1 Tax=Haliangium ochraceum (strain DSM 14365 / JCM 11303 / SMP-2) TaxID=502025 RepID=D0LKJ5_HALO1|nr:sulfatase [Haliangium ochraceum DSM 14365]
MAGAGAGAIDAVWSWSALGQFLPGAGGKLRALLFLAASYGLLCGLLGAALAAVVALYARASCLGRVLPEAMRRHRAARERDPGSAVLGLALVLAGVPTLAAALGIAFYAAQLGLQERKHFGLVIAVTMAATLGAVLAAAALTLLLAHALERALAALARRPGLGALASPRAPASAGLLMLLVAATGAVLSTWSTLRLLPLRPLWIALVAAALSLPALPIGVRARARLSRLRPALRRALPLAAIALAALLVLVTGAPDGVRKATGSYSGLGGPIARVLRTAVDVDRDGYSPLLGGGDCDDWDATVHPGADEIPDDGIDQNCVGGDPSLGRAQDDTGFVPVPSSVPGNFNVVFLTIDTIRADHVGAYGYQRPTTPTLDALAADGALFVNGWAHAPSTRYSIPALLTGRLPLEVAYDTAVRGWPGLLPEADTLAEYAQRAGLTTGAILNYWYFDRYRRMDQGFGHYDNENQKLHRAVSGKGPAETSGSSSKQQTDKALRFIDQHAAERFFLWVHYYDPHYQYEAHAEVPSFGSEDGGTPGQRDLYDQEIRFTDMHIGRLVQDLKRRGLYQRTVIVVTGDHGEGFGEHGIDLHGYHLYAAQTKVPFIIRVPGLAPTRVSMPVGHVDVLPTLANLLGRPASPSMMGRSLLGVMSGQADGDAERYVFQQLSYENNNEMRAAVSRHCHVIYNVSPDTSWEIYRLADDPDEERDIVDAPGDCEPARRALEAWYDRAELPEGALEALLAERPDVAQPLGVHFGQEVELLAVELPPGPVRAGQQMPVTFTFAAHGPLPSGWRVFAHFEGPGRFLGDHEPPRPFSWWREGQYIRYTREITVPRQARPGDYELWLGLFRKAERMPARSDGVPVDGDRVKVATVRVR